MRRFRVLSYALTVSTTTLLLLGGLASQASAGSHAAEKAPAPIKTSTAGGSRHFQLRTTLPGVRLERESILSNGDYTATWKAPGEIVKVAAPSGSTVTIMAHTSSTAGVAVTLPKGGLKPSHINRNRLRLASTIVPNALAVGFTPSQTRTLIHQARRGMHSLYNVGDIIATPCASAYGDNGHAWGRACDTQKFLQDNGGGNWIIGDQVVGSGNDSYCCTANLTRLAAWVSYGANNNIFSWSPSATITEGQCSNWTASLGYNGTGLSANTNVCSDRLDPVDANSGTQFGSAWSGCDSPGYTEGVASADIDNNPWNASDYVTLYVSISWITSWC